jgi:hypothetical protein
MEKLNVFISYSWKQKLERSVLVSCLKDSTLLRIIVDIDRINTADPIHPRISQLIDEADVVVCLITQDSLLSTEVREELVRAHERGKVIVPVVRPDIDQSRLPHFLRDLNCISYSNDSFEETARQVRSKLLDIQPQPHLSKDLQKIKSAVLTNEIVPRFKAEIIGRVLRNALDEIRYLSSDVFRFDIGVERNFLFRAEPLFQNASETDAISLSSVSSFWLDPLAQALARQYTKSQPSATRRLFVLDSEKEFDRYMAIFTLHYETYGKDGGVLITNMNGYSELLNEIVPSAASQQKYMSHDFGTLRFANGIDTSIVHAELNRGVLECRVLPFMISYEIDHERMREIFLSFVNASPWLINYRSQRIVRWEGGANEAADSARKHLFGN